MDSWCDLPPEVLGLVIARLPNTADRARLRAVCRSWHSAARHHTCPQMPWIVPCPWDGAYLVSPSDSNGCSHRLPRHSICIGSTGHWLALGLADFYFSNTANGHAYRHRIHNFILHNPFSGKSVPLTVLDNIVVDEACQIRKFLMPSTPDDFIAVVTNNLSYPLIVFQQGRDTWLPGETRYRYIIDVAFLGDTLYAITKTEDLIAHDLELNGYAARPMVTMGKRVIKRSPGYDDHNGWSTDDDDDDDDGASDEEEVEKDSNEEATTTDEEENDYDDDDDADDYEASKYCDNHSFSFEYASDDETGRTIITSRHLIESRGKLLLVRLKQRSRTSPLIRRVDVFEADVDTGRWVPLPVDNGLGGDQALFISTCFSKFVSALPRGGEVEADVVYDINTGEAFDFRSQTSRPSRFYAQGKTWLFHPELVL